MRSASSHRWGRSPSPGLPEQMIEHREGFES